MLRLIFFSMSLFAIGLALGIILAVNVSVATGVTTGAIIMAVASFLIAIVIFGDNLAEIVMSALGIGGLASGAVLAVNNGWGPAVMVGLPLICLSFLMMLYFMLSELGMSLRFRRYY